MDVAAVVRPAEAREQPCRVALDDDVVGRARRTMRCQHERVDAPPRPGVGAERRLERRAAHEDGAAARLEVAEAVSLRIPRRLGELRRAPVGRRDVAVEAHAHAGADLHGAASSRTRADGRICPQRVLAATGASRDACAAMDRRVVIVAIPDVQPLDVTGPAEVFAAAATAVARGAAPGYAVEVVAPGGGA